MAEVEEKGDVFRALIDMQRSIGEQAARMERSIGEQAARTERSIGELSAKTDRLIFDVGSLNVKFDAVNGKVDGLRMRLAWLTGASAVVGFLFATALAVVKFLPIAGALK